MIEQALAGVLLHKPESINEIIRYVTPEDFADIRARRVFELCLSSVRDGMPFDLVIAAHKMNSHAVWLAEAHDAVPVNPVGYARAVGESGKKRRIKEELQSVIKSADDESPETLLAMLSTLHGREIGSDVKGYSIGNIVERTRRKIEENRKLGTIHGVHTGFDFLEQILVRFVPGMIWVVTGFQGTGKTSFMIEVLSRLAAERVNVISTEMTEEQLVARLVARNTGFHTQLVLSGKMSERELGVVEMNLQEIESRNLTIIDDVFDISEIEAVVMQRAMEDQPGLTFVDYVQNCTVRGHDGNEQEIMAKRLQHLAKRARTCIVALSQVSNAVGRGEITQFEAKGSGAWGAVADVGVRLKKKKDDNSCIMFDMQKARHTESVEKMLRFENNFTRLSEW